MDGLIDASRKERVRARVELYHNHVVPFSAAAKVMGTEGMEIRARVRTRDTS